MEQVPTCNCVYVSCICVFFPQTLYDISEMNQLIMKNTNQTQWSCLNVSWLTLHILSYINIDLVLKKHIVFKQTPTHRRQRTSHKADLRRLCQGCRLWVLLEFTYMVTKLPIAINNIGKGRRTNWHFASWVPRKALPYDLLFLWKGWGKLSNYKEVDLLHCLMFWLFNDQTWTK